MRFNKVDYWRARLAFLIMPTLLKKAFAKSVATWATQELVENLIKEELSKH